MGMVGLTVGLTIGVTVVWQYVTHVMSGTGQ
jgi:hypothetical protein